MRLSNYYLLYNLRENHPLSGSDETPDISSDWDVQQTVDLLFDGLESIGLPIEAVSIGEKIELDHFTFGGGVISICEMHGGSYREALIPSLCELTGTPYAFSPPDVMVNTLNKDVCNYLVRKAGVGVPDWLSVSSGDDPRLDRLDSYPYIVKPVHEGSGMGIDDKSVVYSYDELTSRVCFCIASYKQNAIVQKYINGDEVTIGVVGNEGDIEPLSPILMDLGGKKVYGYDAKEGNFGKINETTISNWNLKARIEDQALIAYRELGCKDCARVDFRIDDNGTPMFIEINPLPHFHPTLGDFVRSAALKGYSYEALLKLIVKRIYE